MTTELSQSEIDKLLHGIRIPPQPQVMLDLRRAQEDPDCSVETVAHVVSHDPGLAGSIIKAVNSPLFGLKQPVTSIKQAVTRLGLRSVMSIAEAFALRCALSEHDHEALTGFWDNVADISNAAALVARRIGYGNPEEAYCFALFHNCAIPALLMRFPQYLEVVQMAYDHAAVTQDRVIETENRLLNTNHAVVGYFIAKAWHMPAYFCEAIAEHHNVRQVFLEDGEPDTRKRQLLAILKIAEYLTGTARVLGRQASDSEWAECCSEILLQADLTDDDLDSLRDQLRNMGVSTL